MAPRKTAKRICKDCKSETRPAPNPGPRCATCHRARRSTTRTASWERRLWDTYGITGEEYWEIYAAQGGCCYICQRAKGTGHKRLSVDHCHKTGVVRGLLCGPCNRDVVGHLRDDPDAFRRGQHYLMFHPAVDIIGERIVPDMRVPDLTSNVGG